MIHRAAAGLRARARVLALILLILGVAGSATACGAAGGASPDGKTIRYQSYAGQVDIAELADALGYIPGITLQRIGDVQGGPQSLQALATGQTDTGAAFNGAIANVIANGTPIKAVVSYYGSNKDSYGEVLVKNGSPIKKAQDLIGKKVAVNTLGANLEAVLDTWFTKSGMTPDQIKQVTLVPLPSINSEAALRNGQVDAAYLSGSLLQIALKKGGLTPIVKDTDVVGDYNGGSICMSDQYLQEHPDVAQEFISGMAKAVQYTETHSADDVKKVYDAYLQSHGRGDAVAALSAWTGTGVATPGGAIRDQDFSTWTQWLQQKGLIKGSLDVPSLYTNQYNPFAHGSGSSAGGSSPSGTESN